MLPESNLEKINKQTNKINKKSYSKLKSYGLTVAETVFKKLFCPSSKNFLYIQKPSSKMLHPHQQGFFVVVHKQFLQQYLNH